MPTSAGPPRVVSLDGVRGLALVAILAFHARPGWLPGAALSVTVFFTLSGFLITSLLLREVEATGRLDLRRFWSRRVRRLAPASVATLLLVATLVHRGLPAGRDVVGDAVAAMTWTANWRFVATGSTYESLFRDPSPFQHFWSLAIEEQVYLLLPLLVLLLARGRSGRARLGAVVVAGIAASTWAVATAATDGTGGVAYYGTHARIAEPLVGAFLAVVLTRPTGFVRLPRPWARLAGAGGLAALGGLGYLMLELSVEDPRLYRGGFLLGAGLAAVVIVAATQRTVLSRLLGARALVFLGGISYAAYLFHWPVFQWIDPQQQATPALLAAELTVTVALATLSTRLLEDPIRRRAGEFWRFATGWWNGAVAGVAAVAVVVSVPAGPLGALELGLDASDPVPPPPVTAASAPAPGPPVQAAAAGGRDLARGPAAPPTTAPAVTAQEAELLTGEGSGDDWASGRAQDPPPSGAAQLRVAVVGDSLAHNVARGLAAWAQERGDVVVYDLSISFCPLSRGGERRWEAGHSFAVNPACGWWEDGASARSMHFQAFAPDVVVSSAAISELLDRRRPEWGEWRTPLDGSYRRWLLDEYTTMANTLQLRGSPGVRFLTLNAPCADFRRARGLNRVGRPEDRVASLNQRFYPLLAGTAGGDLFSQLCPDGRYEDELWGIPDARPDGVHLSDAAAAELARRWLGPLVLQVAGRGEPTPELLEPDRRFDRRGDAVGAAGAQSQ